MADFHFSPRANRASDIAWRVWGEDAFAQAAASDKPILLGISAVWCHWCHVMDETSYSDSAVIDEINRNFVPVRVDNDERPDINARYNMGGWPTTAFLTPDGELIAGFTYLPPSQMQRALGEISTFYATNRDRIVQRVQTARAARDATAILTPDALHGSIVVDVAQKLVAGYDAEFGGFGDAPKFPQAEGLEFLLSRWRATQDPSYYEIVAHTMRAMSRGGMYDHVEGGFFRYSTTRDWSVPHFEKMSEDHAGLVRVLAGLQLWAPSPQWRETLKSALRYLRTVLRDKETALFAGSQDADEEYFALDLSSRNARKAPYIDRRSYSNWTAALAGAFAWASSALDDDELAAESTATLDSLHERMRDEDGLLFHVLEPGKPPRIRGLLTDQTAYLRALLDAHEHAGDARFLSRAIAHADLIIERFFSPGGGFYDRASFEVTIGRLELSDRPILENGIMAETLVRLGTLTGEARFRERAQATLALYTQSYGDAGPFAATYARALDRFLAPEVSLRLTGSPETTAEFREAAFRLPAPFVSIATQPSSENAAYVCCGTVCAAPVRDAAGIRDAYDSVARVTG